MSHHTPLIATIVVGLVLAFALGALAHRLRISPLVGYLLAGMLVGPFTPGFVADQAIANELAEIGVILLMFGVGLHFSLEGPAVGARASPSPARSCRSRPRPLLGMGLAWLLGWSVGAGIVFGLALSVASTVVLLRALQERRLLETERGRIAVGWLIVEDLAMVLTLVLLPALAPVLQGRRGRSIVSTLALPLAITLGKVAAFVAIMLIVGKRVIPWILHYVAHTGSRELFRLAVLAIALGVAFGAAMLFDVSFALGAFFAGMILSESELSQRAAKETLPLRDAFAVLFFVSVGMLFDPMIVLREPLAVLATVLIIVVGKSLAAFVIVRLFGHPHVDRADDLGEPRADRRVLVHPGRPRRRASRCCPSAGAISSSPARSSRSCSIRCCFAALDRWLAKTATAKPAPAAGATPAAARQPPRARTSRSRTLTDHVVLVGHGRVGSFVSARACRPGTPLLVIEDDADRVAQAQGARAARRSPAMPPIRR